MTARDQVVTLLESILPADYVVIPYARAIDPPAKPTVLVRLETVIPGKNTYARAYQFALVLVPTKNDPKGPADAELDAFLEAVLDAIDDSDLMLWARAQRGTYQDTTYPAYEVTLTAGNPKE